MRRQQNKADEEGNRTCYGNQTGMDQVAIGLRKIFRQFAREKNVKAYATSETDG